MIRRVHRRAFTVVEVMLALVLASIVLAVMIGLLGLLTGADASSLKRVEQETDLAVAQNLIRRSMVSLGAVAPMDASAMREALRTNRAADVAAEESEAASPSERDQEGLGPMAPVGIAPMFDLYFADLGNGFAAPVLECVLVDPPGMLMPSAQPTNIESFRSVPKGSTHAGALLSRRIVQSVRGRFEVGPTLDNRWALQWRGIDPPSEPVTLISGVSGLEWWALPIDEGQEKEVPTLSAKLASEFPIAVRLAIWTDDGQYLDWTFETETQLITVHNPEPEVAPTDDENEDGAEDEGDGEGNGQDEEDHE